MTLRLNRSTFGYNTELQTGFNNEGIEEATKQLIVLAEQSEFARALLEPLTESIQKLSDILPTIESYQKKGYPLGKSNRGFNKWQSRKWRKTK